MRIKKKEPLLMSKFRKDSTDERIQKENLKLKRTLLTNKLSKKFKKGPQAEKLK